MKHCCYLFSRSPCGGGKVRSGKSFDSCLRLYQRSTRNSGQELGRYSRAERHTRKRCRSRRHRHGYVEFHEDRSGARGRDGNAGVEATRETRGCCRRSRFCGVRCGAMDHGCQYSRRWRFEALTDNVRNAMNNTLSKGKEIKIPGPDHPITISPAGGKVRVTVAGKIVAESTRALRLEEKGYPPVYYLPPNDADMSLLLRTTHYTYCPYKGDCTYYSIPIGGTKSEYAVWTYERPYEAVASIREYLAFYPSRVDAIEVVS